MDEHPPDFGRKHEERNGRDEDQQGRAEIKDERERDQKRAEKRKSIFPAAEAVAEADDERIFSHGSVADLIAQVVCDQNGGLEESWGQAGQKNLSA